MSNGDVEYHLSIVGRHLALLREWRTRMASAEDASRFGGALAFILRRLQRDPNEWGDPIRVLHHAGLTVRRGLHDGILVEYGIDEARLLVYVRDIRLAPWHPLQRGDE